MIACQGCRRGLTSAEVDRGLTDRTGMLCARCEDAFREASVNETPFFPENWRSLAHESRPQPREGTNR